MRSKRGCLIVLAMLSALGVLPAALGVFLGIGMRTRIGSQTFRKVVLVTLLAMGFAFMINFNSFFSALAG